jgi:hypothetical protein
LRAHFKSDGRGVTTDILYSPFFMFQCIDEGGAEDKDKGADNSSDDGDLLARATSLAAKQLAFGTFNKRSHSAPLFNGCCD